MTSALTRISQAHALGVRGLSARTLAGADQHIGWATLEDVWFEPGAWVPLHIHDYNEAGIAQEGTLEFQVGAERMTVIPGDVVSITAGTPHQVQNRSGAPAHHLAIASVRSDAMAAQTHVLTDPAEPVPPSAGSKS